jgi:hypothetical protein
VYIIYYFQYIYFKDCDVVYILLPFSYHGCQYVQPLNDAVLFNLQLLHFVFITFVNVVKNCSSTHCNAFMVMWKTKPKIKE